MDTVVVQINNNQAFDFFRNLEALNVIKVLYKLPYVQTATMKKTKIVETNNAKRLSEIRDITKNINIDLTGFRFNREEANNYDE